MNNELSPQFIQALTTVYKQPGAGVIEPTYDVVVGDESHTRREGTLGAFHDSAPWLHLGYVFSKRYFTLVEIFT